MNDVKTLAKEVFLGRKEAEVRINQGVARKSLVKFYVGGILKIFEISNQAKGATVLIWKLRLEQWSIDKKWLSIMFAVDKDSNACFYNTIFLEDSTVGNLKELKQVIDEARIPVTLLHDIYEYFVQNLSSYFDVESKQVDGREQIIIELKEPSTEESKE